MAESPTSSRGTNTADTGRRPVDAPATSGAQRVVTNETGLGLTSSGNAPVEPATHVVREDRLGEPQADAEPDGDRNESLTDVREALNEEIKDGPAGRGQPTEPFTPEFTGDAASDTETNDRTHTSGELTQPAVTTSAAIEDANGADGDATAPVDRSNLSVDGTQILEPDESSPSGSTQVNNRIPDRFYQPPPRATGFFGPVINAYRAFRSRGTPVVGAVRYSENARLPDPDPTAVIGEPPPPSPDKPQDPWAGADPKVTASAEVHPADRPSDPDSPSTAPFPTEVLLPDEFAYSGDFGKDKLGFFRSVLKRGGQLARRANQGTDMRVTARGIDVPAAKGITYETFETWLDQVPAIAQERWQALEDTGLSTNRTREDYELAASAAYALLDWAERYKDAGDKDQAREARRAARQMRERALSSPYLGIKPGETEDPSDLELKWLGRFTADMFARYATRLTAMIPDRLTTVGKLEHAHRKEQKAQAAAAAANAELSSMDMTTPPPRDSDLKDAAKPADTTPPSDGEEPATPKKSFKERFGLRKKDSDEEKEAADTPPSEGEAEQVDSGYDWSGLSIPVAAEPPVLPDIPDRPTPQSRQTVPERQPQPQVSPRDAARARLLARGIDLSRYDENT